MKLKVILATAIAFITAAASPTTGIADQDESPFVGEVRQANERFTDVAVATEEGYEPIPCASGASGGAMGIHYVNGGYLENGELDVARPEAVMYEPQPDGSLKLVAVEYISFEGPASLGGHLFNYVGEPNRYGLDPFYQLHVWAWRPNANGTFADMNPDVSCDAARASYH